MASSQRQSVLLVEDALPLARVYEGYLNKEPYEIIHVETGAAALQCAAETVPAAVILDVKLPDMDGLDVLRTLRQRGINCPVVIITGHGTVNLAVDAMKAGAADFILKPFAADRLIYTLRNVLEHQKLVEIVDVYKNDFDRREYCGFIGPSIAMQTVYRIIESAAPSRATIFITGQSGTGKEVCAEAIHRQSARRDKPFVPINCAAIPKDLMESEIFGHVKGAFTGAVSERGGAASMADGGTLFLDEVCEMDLALQAKLLRFVQTGSFQRVGDDTTQSVDVRIVCATNRDPWGEVQAGNFREDLYYRLHVIPIEIPPLRDRADDVIELANHFLTEVAREEGKNFACFDDEANQLLRSQPWPGNVRQLQNVIRNAVVLNDGETLTGTMLGGPLGGAQNLVQAGRQPQSAASATSTATVPGPKGIRPMHAVEMDCIRDALAVTDGNVPRAAALLEISPSTIYRRLREMDET